MKGSVMPNGSDDNFTFDADLYEAERFVAELLTIEKGIHPIARFKAIPGSQEREKVVEEADSLYLSWENLTRKMGWNYDTTFEIKGNNPRMANLMRAFQKLGITSVAQARNQKFFEVMRKKSNWSDAKSGRSGQMTEMVPIRLVTPEEAAKVKAKRDSSEIDIADDDSTINAAIKEVIAGKSHKAFLAVAEEHAVLGKLSDLEARVIGLEKVGEISRDAKSGKWLVKVPRTEE